MKTLGVGLCAQGQTTSAFYETDIPTQQMDIPRMKGEIPVHDSIEEVVA